MTSEARLAEWYKNGTFAPGLSSLIQTVLNNAWPRVRDLPEEQQEPFTQWLAGQTRPMIPDVPMSQQDGYFPWDYERWIKRLPVID